MITPRRQSDNYQLTSSNSVLYYYAVNSRGDVVGIYTASGSLLVVYEYDAWGNILSVKNANGVNIANPNSIANIQSLRYRGYCYDTDTGLYYLQSRYYDPVTHRFINTDGLVSTDTGVLGHNMFVYCNNNPIILSDISGNYPTYSGYTYDGMKFSGVPMWELGYYGQIKEYWADNLVEYLYENTTITQKSTNYYSVTIPLYSTGYDLFATYSNESIEMQMRDINKLILAYLIDDSNGSLSISYSDESQLWGEMLVHAYGLIYWDISNCYEIDLDISKDSVNDTHEGMLGVLINTSSFIIGRDYYKYDLLGD